MTLREFYGAKSDQLMAHNSHEAYKEIASELHFDVLGTLADEEQLVALRDDLGTLADEKWRHLPWQMPPDEASPCWSQRVTHMHRHYLAFERYPLHRSTGGGRLVLASLVGLPKLRFHEVPRERFRARQK